MVYTFGNLDYIFFCSKYCAGKQNTLFFLNRNLAAFLKEIVEFFGYCTGIVAGL